VRESSNRYLVEIVPGVHMVNGVNANSYIVLESDGSLTLIDTGMSRDGRKILDYIQASLGKKPSDVRTVILTHSHVDHVRGAYAIKKASGAKIAIHALDADYLSGNKKMTSPKGLLGFLFRMMSPFLKFHPIEADKRLNDNDKIGTLTIIHTPGHTPGSICIYEQSRRLIFVGDTLGFRRGKVEGAPKQFSVDMDEVQRSVEKISKIDFDVMLSGHGKPLKGNASARVKEHLSRKNL
jgi:glyoxylase-like metal-dependent hydrolase (beta-lactamase superfamily II)